MHPVSVRTWLVSLVAAYCACLPAAAGRAAAAAEQGQGPDFVVEPVDGEAAGGTLAGIEHGWQISLQADEMRTWDGADLIALRRKDRTVLLGPSGSQLLLANGDRVRAIAHDADQETLAANSELLGDLRVPLERLSALAPNPPADRSARERFCRRLTASRREHDLLVLANGDELSGSFLGMDDQTVRFDSGQGPLDIERNGVQAVALSSDLIAFPKPSGLYATVLLADGSQLTLLSGRLEAGNLRGRAAFGADVSLPIEQVLEVGFHNGRSVDLSDVEPAEYHHVPYLSLRYPFERDRTILGNPIRLHGTVYRKGLSMHSRSELSYDLDGSFSRFEATAGIDDETGGQGSVVFRVLLDGKPAWQSGVVAGGSAAQPVRVDLKDAKRLTLVVDFADQGDVQDHADWAAARLIR
jgi:hypothetical protein